MMKKIGALVLALALALSLTACGQKAEQTTVQEEPESGEAEPVELVVFAAASMTETLTEIADLYKDAAPQCDADLQLRFLRHSADAD